MKGRAACSSKEPDGGERGRERGEGLPMLVLMLATSAGCVQTVS